MKQFFLALLGLVLSLSAFCQNWDEVVYLKNGSIIRGTVIEQIPGETLKIKTADGSVFQYRMSEVEKITKEEAPVNRGGTRYPGPYRYADKVEISRGDFYLNGRELDDYETRQFIGDEIYNNTFIPARRQRKAGMVLSTIGGVVTGVGTIVTIVGVATSTTTHTWYQDSSGRTWGDKYTDNISPALLAGAIIAPVGFVILGTGIPLMVIGTKRLNWVEEDANDKLSHPMTLNLNSSANGFGLCLNF